MKKHAYITMETDAFKLHKFKEPVQEEIEAILNMNLQLTLPDDLNGISQDKPVSYSKQFSSI